MVVADPAAQDASEPAFEQVWAEWPCGCPDAGLLSIWEQVSGMVVRTRLWALGGAFVAEVVAQRHPAHLASNI
jgi:hypothetical protein